MTTFQTKKLEKFKQSWKPWKEQVAAYKSKQGEFHWPFEELEVWHLSQELSDMVFELTKKYPKEERYGLIDQSRRAADAVANLIAEGKGAWSQAIYLDRLYRARGELYETVNCAIKAGKRKYLTQQEFKDIYDLSFLIHGKLSALMRSIQGSQKQTG